MCHKLSINVSGYAYILGAGYYVLKNLSIDAKFVIGLTHISTDKNDDSSLKQFGIGVGYLF